MPGDVLILSLVFLISFTHVGQISFQNQPNAICTHVGGNVAGQNIQLTGDTLITKILYADKKITSKTTETNRL